VETTPLLKKKVVQNVTFADILSVD